MKVVFLKDVPKQGKKYEVKDVANGHALNLLIPQGLAEAGTDKAIKKAGLLRKQEDAEKKIHEDLLAKNLGDIEGATIHMSGKASDKGHLFAGIHKEALVKELQKETRLQISPEFIILDAPLKTVGEHEVVVKAGGKEVKFKVIIKPEGTRVRSDPKEAPQDSFSPNP